MIVTLLKEKRKCGNVVYNLTYAFSTYREDRRWGARQKKKKIGHTNQTERRVHKKTVKWLHILSSFYSFVQNFYWAIPGIGYKFKNVIIWKSNK